VIHELLGLFPGNGLPAGDFQPVDAADVPEPYRRLLVHREHMTVTLEERYGTKVHLVVLERRHDRSTYARKLILRAGVGGPVILAGIMRIRLDVCGPEARDRIISESTPLGRVLIEQGFLRSIENLAFFRVRMGEALRGLFEATGRATFTYCRTAGISLGGEPAVELLEIVSPEGA
jgi:hypothetical protein